MGAAMMADRAMVENAIPKVEVISGVSTTEYRIRGSLPDVLEGISAVFTTWPAQGYGTMAHTIQQESGSSYVARMSRSNSCD